MFLHGLAVIFFFNSLITAALAFIGLSGGAAEITKGLFYAFAVVFAGLLGAELVFFMRRGRAPLR